MAEDKIASTPAPGTRHPQSMQDGLACYRERAAKNYAALPATRANGKWSSLSPRDFIFVRQMVEDVIRAGSEEDARKAATCFVDEWAAEVVNAHIGKSSFRIRAQAEIIAACTTPHFGLLGSGPNAPEWVGQVNHLMNDRLKYWMERSGRRRDMRDVRLRF